MNELIFIKLAGLAVLLNLGMLFMLQKFPVRKRIRNYGPKLNNIGAAGDAGDGKGGDGGDGKGGIQFSKEQQEFVDKLVDKKYKSWKEEESTKYGDYGELKKFKQEHQQQLDAKAQQDLEAAKKYDEAKQAYEGKIKERDAIISKKDEENRSLRIEHHLTNEIGKQNGYSEEVLALLRGQASIDDKGNVTLKIRDSNNIEQTVPAAEGVKKLLESKPYLVRSTHKAGAGGAGGGGGAGGAGGAGDATLDQLNADYLKAFYAGNIKQSREIKEKINAKLAERKTAAAAK